MNKTKITAVTIIAKYLFMRLKRKINQHDRLILRLLDQAVQSQKSNQRVSFRNDSGRLLIKIIARKGYIQLIMAFTIELTQTMVTA